MSSFVTCDFNIFVLFLQLLLDSFTCIEYQCAATSNVCPYSCDTAHNKCNNDIFNCHSNSGCIIGVYLINIQICSFVLQQYRVQNRLCITFILQQHNNFQLWIGHCQYIMQGQFIVPWHKHNIIHWTHIFILFISTIMSKSKFQML